MNIIEIINQKRNHQELTKEEIQFCVEGYLQGNIKDYQMSALLMAICLNGMKEEEIFNLTDVMLKSGKVVDLHEIPGIKVDKHSTGGVGDKTTLVLAPIVAACSVNVAKMSGRGLGHTGGTIDKLESIPGFSVSLSLDEFQKQVEDIHLAVVSQMDGLVPADKKIYALRDVTGTVESIPLIASSIMSKKLASGADKIVIDVKVGNGALVKTLEEARSLAHLMVKIGNNASKQTVCVLTNMNQPLGYAIGNALEVEESMDFLKGNYGPDMYELIMTLAPIMVSMGKNITIEEAKRQVEEVLTSQKAYQTFLEFVKRQHGDITALTHAPHIIDLKAPKSGYIASIDAYGLGECARKLGAGRLTKEDVIDPSVGLVLKKKVGDFINEGETLVSVYYNHITVLSEEVISCFRIDTKKPADEPFIYEVID